MHLRILTLFILGLSIAFTTGCSTNKEKRDTKERSVNKKSADVLYAQAKRQIEKKNFITALETLDTLEAQHAFSPQAIQGQLDRIYAHYKLQESNEAISAASRFLRAHPQHPKADYAFYMIGLARYEQSRGTFERYFPVDISKRDAGALKLAFQDFSKIVNAFPNSEYAADSRQRMVYIRNMIARNEIHVANFYFKRQAYLAAANRGRYVVENFPKTQAVADGLAVMTQAYTLLGLTTEANDAFNTLKTSFPNHPSIDKNGKFNMQLTQERAQRSWFNKLTLGLLAAPQPPKFDNRS